ncbi:tripartite tricarboxylate transporter TctB family protein [Pseudahrensia aquimaris]|uniref:Tripartite tricarboxylate transporter TctB family protein n=1 Tax=Pseudahrensia aquimaris TaxID=744461 RepID=A0ABW3FHR0_9HYPH
MSIRLGGAAIFLVAAFFAWVGQSYTTSFGDPLGPTIFPLLVGIPTMLLAASMVIFPSGEVTWPEPRRIAQQVGALAVLIAYSMLLKPLGFPIATFGLISALAAVLGGPPKKALLLGAVMSLSLWVLFDQILGLPLAFLGAWFK